MAPATTHHLYPPFPAELPTAPLVSVSLAKLKASDGAESKAFFDACRSLGFFYLDTTGSPLGCSLVAEAERLNDLQARFFKMPNHEKEEYAREKVDPFFGYRHGDLGTCHDDGTPKRNESYNMRKDDFEGNCEALPHPSLIKKHWALLQSYVRHCRAVIDLMLTHLEVHLELPIGTLANLHRIKERSGDHVRFNQRAIQPYSDGDAKQGEHTDFGTLTILFNWLGGLQIRRPDTEDWVYVKPVPGHAIINLGDSLVKFTAGILRSNVHRVVVPPAPQDTITRNSLVYFSRPEDTVVLRRLRGGLIDKQPRAETVEPEMTSQEWILRRSVGDLKGVYTHSGGLELRPQMAAGRV
ncbi:hypothetical protein LTR02_002605 [Friedmanniomyces endolithicus]|uniref:Fe2OG dioxygenase domain-containing protein n=1 Tax=Friedmanniomyces endolithicus TaxID=329885 RepID=A0A4U0URY4_9PEZI|nr:hypothetical protein LTS09_005586 [Friedmanniomyces endolithicus]KAK0365828.1 hypothetical protein LTR94_005250 [Friedmanniomyces endolithicus]KAK0792123.1 hypothetical protein LTR59_008619 [Friedmanniomyces endolithicus]KAK0802269.1 hypothetical protein LTR75_008312 [Friedmanniomyces endolithicus]KAK0804432.1 hypothetical protein LTR38_005845 [Friedmanniomyces endolithicus]